MDDDYCGNLLCPDGRHRSAFYYRKDKPHFGYVVDVYVYVKADIRINGLLSEGRDSFHPEPRAAHYFLTVEQKLDKAHG